MNKKTLVLGASLKKNRYSNIAIKRLSNKGHEVVAVGSTKGEVDTVSIEIEKPYFEGIDTVTLYLNPALQRQYFDYIVSLRPKRVIFNPGTVNFEFKEILEKNSIRTEDACTLVLLATNQY